MAQPWPAWNTAMDSCTAMAKSGASSRMILADLPPSSRKTRFSVAAPFSMMRLPTAVEPVKEITSTRGSVDQHFAGHGGIGGADHVEYARREAGFGRQFAHDRAHQRRVRRGLQHHGAAGEQRGDDLADVDVQRHVPRRDRADHAQRFVHHDAVADRRRVRCGGRGPLPRRRRRSIAPGRPRRPSAQSTTRAAGGAERSAGLRGARCRPGVA